MPPCACSEAAQKENTIPAPHRGSPMSHQELEAKCDRNLLASRRSRTLSDQDQRALLRDLSGPDPQEVDPARDAAIMFIRPIPGDRVVSGR
jgi:hypothetical protein